MKKKWFITTLVLGVVVSFGFGLKLLHVNAASTPTTATLSMQNGAAVRLAEGSNGLRFSAEISESEYTALEESGAIFGAVIIPNDKISGDSTWTQKIQFDINNENQASFTDTYSSASILQVFNARCQNIDADENIEIAGSVVNFQAANLTRPYVGAIYVGIPTATQDVTDAETGETTTVATEYEYRFAPWYGGDMANNTRCMYYVAQRAIEEAEKELAAATVEEEKTFFQTTVETITTEYINKSTLTGSNYGYYVTHHYVDAKGNEKSFTHKQYGLLNQTATAAVAAETDVPSTFGIDVSKYTYDAAKTKNNGAPLDEGKVYAAGMQTLHIYYKPQEAAEIIADLFAQENASSIYTGGTMELDENGNLVNTSGSTGGIGDLFGTGQKTVCLTAAFIYEMQRLGYTKINVTNISVTISASIGSLFGKKVTGVQLDGYLGETNQATYTVTNNKTSAIEWDISQPITRTQNADGTYSYVYTHTDGTTSTAEDVTISAITNSSFNIDYTAEWTLNGLTVS